MAKVFSDGLNTVYGKQGGTGAAFILPDSQSAAFAVKQQQLNQANQRLDALAKIKADEARRENINKALREIKPAQGWTRYNADLTQGFRDLTADAQRIMAQGGDPTIDPDFINKQYQYQQAATASTEWKKAFEEGIRKLNTNPGKYRMTVEDFISAFPQTVEEGIQSGFVAPGLPEKFTVADVLKNIKATSQQTENAETGFSFKGANEDAIREQIYTMYNTPEYQDVARYEYGVDSSIPFLPGLENKKQADLLFKDESSAEELKKRGIDNAEELWQNQQKYMKLNNDLLRKKKAEVDTAQLFDASYRKKEDEDLTPQFNVQDEVAVLQKGKNPAGKANTHPEPSTSLLYFNVGNVADRLSPGFEGDASTGATVKNTKVGDYTISSVELKPVVYGEEPGTEFTVLSDRQVKDIREGKKPGIKDSDIVYKFIARASKKGKDSGGKVTNTSHFFDADVLNGSKKIDMQKINEAILTQDPEVQKKFFLGLVRRDPELRSLTQEQQEQLATELMRRANQ